MAPDDANLDSISDDGYWQLREGEWIATEKQIIAIEGGAIPYDSNLIIENDNLIIIPTNTTMSRYNIFNAFSKLQPEQKMFVFSGVCILAIFLSLIVIVASISPAVNTLSDSKDCETSLFGMMPIGNSVDALSLEKCPHRLNIASWNLQVFGQSKANNQDSISEIAEKISQYDIVAVQELKDVQQTAPYMLQDELDNHETFGMVLSNRTGEFCESKNTGGISEQYAFYYNDATINSLDSGYHYPNNDCEFAREPFAARFKSAEYSHDFVLITLHVKPDDAVNEISALTNVFEWAKFQFPDEDDFILLGDLNADCDYASKSNLDELEIRNQNYEWIIPDGTKTNTAVSSSCTYDRIIFSDTGSEEYLDSYSTDCQSDVSDHCIISGLFSSHES